MPFSGTSSIDKSCRFLMYMNALWRFFRPEDNARLRALLSSNSAQNGIHAHLDYSWNILPLSKNIHSAWGKALLSLSWVGAEPQDNGLYLVKLQLHLLPRPNTTALPGSDVEPTEPVVKPFARRVNFADDKEIDAMFTMFDEDTTSPPSLQMGNIDCYTCRPVVHGQIIQYPNVPPSDIENLRLMIDIAHKCITIWRMAGGADPDELVEDETSPSNSPVSAIGDTNVDLDVDEEPLVLDNPNPIPDVSTIYPQETLLQPVHDSELDSSPSVHEYPETDTEGGPSQ